MDEIKQEVSEVSTTSIEEPQKETEPSKEQVKTEEKRFTQTELDEIIERRLFRANEKFTKEKESLLVEKEKEYSEKLKSIESEKLSTLETLKKTELENIRLRYSIKEDKFDEVLALRDFKVNKDPKLDPIEALQIVLNERPDYADSKISQIGIEITQSKPVQERYTRDLMSQYSFLGLDKK